eukprot:13472360-Alexandrium_andersonii.AAC.1
MRQDSLGTRREKYHGHARVDSNAGTIVSGNSGGLADVLPPSDGGRRFQLANLLFLVADGVAQAKRACISDWSPAAATAWRSFVRSTTIAP